MEDGLKRPFEPATPTPEERRLENKKADTKPTPDKSSNSANAPVQTNLEVTAIVPKYGSAGWCASFRQCNNEFIQASTNHVCQECKCCVHDECSRTIYAESGSNTPILICIKCHDDNYQPVDDNNVSFVESVGNLSNTAEENAMDTSFSATIDGTADEEEEANSRLSYHLTIEDKDTIIDLISNKKLMNRHSHECSVQALANAAKINMDFVRMEPQANEQMIQDMVTIVTDEEFHRSVMTTKLGMKTISKFAAQKNISIKTKYSRKMTFIAQCIHRMKNMLDTDHIDLKTIFDMSKLTGHFLPDGVLAPAAKDKIIHDSIKEFKTKAIELYSIDKESYDLLQAFINDCKKELAIKAKPDPTYLSNEWCATGFLCKNQKFFAPATLKCKMCKLPVHRGCGHGHAPDDYICKKCAPPPTSTFAPSASETHPTTNSPAHNAPGHTHSQSNTTTTFRGHTITPYTPIRLAQHNATNNAATTPVHCNTAGRPNIRDAIVTRFQIRVDIVPDLTSHNHVALLYHTINEIIAELRRSDRNIQVLPWSDRGVQTPLNLSNNGISFKEIQRYFNRIRAIPAGKSWGDMKLQHTRPFCEILADSGMWLNNHDHAVFPKELQCESTQTVGWFLWSFRSIDTKVLAQELWNLYSIRVDFRYSVISLDGGPIPLELQVKALHIVCESGETYDQVKSVLQTVYCSRATEFPLGIPLRFVPSKGITGLQRLNKVKHCKQLQQTFLAKVDGRQALCWDIGMLDAPVGDLPSLRSLLMEIKSGEGDGSHNLFLSVDTSYNRQELVLVTFIQRFEAEARAFISNMVPIMMHKYKGTRINEYFIESAVERALDSEWDEEKQELISKDDKYWDTFDELEDLDRFGLEKVEISAPEINRIENMLLGIGNDNDSVGSLTSRNQPSTPAALHAINEEQPLQQPIGRSSNTITSTVTDTTKMSQMEQSIHHLETSVEQIQQSIKVVSTLQESMDKLTKMMTQQQQNATAETVQPEPDSMET